MPPLPYGRPAGRRASKRVCLCVWVLLVVAMVVKGVVALLGAASRVRSPCSRFYKAAWKSLPFNPVPPRPSKEPQAALGFALNI